MESSRTKNTVVGLVCAICSFFGASVSNSATTGEAAQFIIFNDEPVTGSKYSYAGCKSSFDLLMVGFVMNVRIKWNNVNWKSATFKLNPDGFGYSIHVACKEACMDTFINGQSIDEMTRLNFSRMGLPVFGPDLDLPAPNDQTRLWKAVEVLRYDCPGDESAF